jgi:hypothetical protein
MPKTNSPILTGTVTAVNLKDSTPTDTLKIAVRVPGIQGIQLAYPLDVNIKRIPLVGENVIIVKSTRPTANSVTQAQVNYYLSPTATQSNVHLNLLPNTMGPVNNDTSYAAAAAGAIGSAAGGFQPNGFEERTDVGSLQPFLGDVLLEGRFGHSLRFGYTPLLSNTTERPSWSAPGKVSEPITIISNGRKSGGSYNKFIIEDVNDDLSSIWLTSKQQLKLKPSQKKIGEDVKKPNVYKDASIVLNSDRLFLNARDERVIISGKKDIINATPKWAMEMDKFFNLMEKLVSELVDLTSAKATYATGVGPTGPATNAVKVKEIFDELKKMKQ